MAEMAVDRDGDLKEQQQEVRKEQMAS